MRHVLARGWLRGSPACTLTLKTAGYVMKTVGPARPHQWGRTISSALMGCLLVRNAHVKFSVLGVWTGVYRPRAEA